MDAVEIVKMMALGLAAGVLSGLFGIGGGLVIVPALTVLFGFPIKIANGTSLCALLAPTGLLGVIEYWKDGSIRLGAGLCIAAGLFVGGYFGAHFVGRIPAASIKKMYAIFLIVVAVYFLLTADRPAGRAPVVVAPPTEAAGDQAVH